MTDERRVPYLGRVYCQQCGLLMSNGSCLHGSVRERLDREYASGATFGGEAVSDRFQTSTRTERLLIHGGTLSPDAFRWRSRR